uniref:Uncharacterized protein n=1 Tax=Brassica oleracea var. oleracea TaxID=109376 RepID=A0A0D3D9M6_BRAOL
MDETSMEVASLWRLPERQVMFYTWWYTHITATSSKISCVCVYLRSMTQYVRSDCGMVDGKEEPTIMFEDETYSAQDLHHPQIAENWRGPRDLQ